MESSSAPVTPQPDSDASPTHSHTLRQSHSYTQPSTSSALPPLATPSASFAAHFPTLPRPHPTVDSSTALRTLCTQTSTFLSAALSTPAVTDQLYAAHQTVQSSMARIDECVALTTAFRATNTQLHTNTLPQLLTSAQHSLPLLYTRIDALTAYTAALEQSVEALESALTTAEAALASQRPVSLNKLISSFKRRGKDDNAALDAWSGVSVLRADEYFDNMSNQQTQAIPYM